MTYAGFVLTGGRSSRMGSDKALLPHPEGGAIICRIARISQRVFGNAALVGSPESYGALFPQYLLIADRRPGQGPLAGIEAALASPSAADWNLVVSCDLPGLTENILSALLEVSATSSKLAVACRDLTGSVHPLCALYRRDVLPIVSGFLDRGERRAVHLLSSLNPDFVDLPDRLVNVNTPEEWRAWQIS